MLLAQREDCRERWGEVCWVKAALRSPPLNVETSLLPLTRDRLGAALRAGEASVLPHTVCNPPGGIPKASKQELK